MRSDQTRWLPIIRSRCTLVGADEACPMRKSQRRSSPRKHGSNVRSRRAGALEFRFISRRLSTAPADPELLDDHGLGEDARVALSAYLYWSTEYWTLRTRQVGEADLDDWPTGPAQRWLAGTAFSIKLVVIWIAPPG